MPCLLYTQGEPTLSDAQLARVSELIEPWFFFALIWSIGSTTDNDGRAKFSEYVREEMKKDNVCCSVCDNLSSSCNQSCPIIHNIRIIFCKIWYFTLFNIRLQCHSLRRASYSTTGLMMRA